MELSVEYKENTPCDSEAFESILRKSWYKPRFLIEHFFPLFTRKKQLMIFYYDRKCYI